MGLGSTTQRKKSRTPELSEMSGFMPTPEPDMDRDGPATRNPYLLDNPNLSPANMGTEKIDLNSGTLNPQGKPSNDNANPEGGNTPNDFGGGGTNSQPNGSGGKTWKDFFNDPEWTDKMDEVFDKYKDDDEFREMMGGTASLPDGEGLAEVLYLKRALEEYKNRDTDGDGTPDEKDPYPDDPDDNPVDSDGDGIPDHEDPYPDDPTNNGETDPTLTPQDDGTVAPQDDGTVTPEEDDTVKARSKRYADLGEDKIRKLIARRQRRRPRKVASRGSLIYG